MSRLVGLFEGGELRSSSRARLMRRVGRGVQSRAVGDVVAGDALKQGFVVEMGSEEVALRLRRSCTPWEVVALEVGRSTMTSKCS
jgi:uncharacterized protein (DUF934 family)